MQEYFEIRPSRAQLVLLIAGHCLLAYAVALYVEPLSMKLGAVLAIGLLGFREASALLGQGRLLLHCNPRSAQIALQCGEQSYFFAKYKVYATRWFAILKLVNKDKNMTLMLNPDRFDSVESYRRLRYQLRRLELSRAA